MANTQTSVPAFTAGQVLTAQQQTEINTGIPVFATTVTRDAAFGGTGEKVLAEGQFAYIEASNTTQYYDGAAWQTVGSGLTLIKAQTIGSAVSSVAVTDVFSATYDNYFVTVSGGVGSTAANLGLQMGSTSTGYYWSGIYRQYTTSTVTADQGANGSSFPYFGRGTTNSLNGQAFVYGPNLAKNTHVVLNSTGAGTADYVNMFGGYLNDTTQYTGLTLTVGTGTITGGTIRVYGYQNS